MVTPTTTRNVQQAEGGSGPDVGRAPTWSLRRALTEDKVLLAAAVIIGLYLIAAILGPLLAPHDPLASNPGQNYQAPGGGFWLGTDKEGRDVFSRLLVGTRYTLLGAFGVMLIATVGGLLYGLVTAYLGGGFDAASMRLFEVILSIPPLVIAMVLVAAFGPGLYAVVLGVGIELSPPAMQRPFPLWVGGRSPGAMRRAARESCHLMLADFILSNAKADYEAYAGALRQAGLRADDFEVAAVAVVFVDQRRDRAWELAGPHLLYQQNQYRRWFTEAGDRASDRFVPARSLDDLERGSYLIGTPDDVRAEIGRLREEVPFTHFSFWMLLPGMDPVVASRSLELFAAEVMPGFKELR
jgi:hypothetical protein